MMEVSGDIEVAISAWKRLVEDRESTIERLRAEAWEARSEMAKAWCGLQTASPWSESNDMLWSDEMLCGIHLLLARAQNAESALAAIKLRLIGDCDAARDFPANTCGASRHAQMIAESLVSGVPYGMLTDDPAYCGQSILSAVKSLFQARTDLAALRKRVEGSVVAIIRDQPGARGYVRAYLSRNLTCEPPIDERVALVVLGEG